MIKDLIKLSNHLDAKGHRKEADYLDAIIRKSAVSNPHVLENVVPTLGSPITVDEARSICQRNTPTFNEEYRRAQGIQAAANRLVSLLEEFRDWNFSVGGAPLHSVSNWCERFVKYAEVIRDGESNPRLKRNDMGEWEEIRDWDPVKETGTPPRRRDQRRERDDQKQDVIR
tara:strand:+ start:16692 stop:17204 length:513 start_codon:yes stop_codon:yes gene_type:complete